MSDAPAPEGKKKKGKLPIILVAVLVLGGGGFMMMKKSGGKEEPPPLALAKPDHMIEIKEEFLANLAGGNNYVKAKIALLPEAKAKKEEIEHLMPMITDTIYVRLRRTSISMLNKPEGLQLLKRQIAQDVNYQLEQLEPKDHKAEEKPKAKKKKHGEEDEHAIEKPEELTALPPEDELEHPEWDHEEGPILKVFFTSFATQ